MAGTACGPSAAVASTGPSVAASIEAEANAIAQSLLLTQAYVPPFSSTTARDQYCAVHHGDAAPVPYAFGTATPYGY